MKTDPETEQKILAHIEMEWENFIGFYNNISPKPNASTIAALKAGFYSGFRAGVCAMHDADKIL